MDHHCLDYPEYSGYVYGGLPEIRDFSWREEERGRSGGSCRSGSGSGDYEFAGAVMNVIIYPEPVLPAILLSL